MNKANLGLLSLAVILNEAARAAFNLNVNAGGAR